MTRNSLFILLLLLFFPLSSGAAILYLEPSSSGYYQGDTFIVEAKIDTQGECINTVKVELSFASNVLEIKDFSQGNSLLSLWAKEPEFSNETGLVSFSGGIPGGYCGELAGDPGTSNLLGRMIFQVYQTPLVNKPISTKIEFSENSYVLLHDGLGTKASLITNGALLSILSGIPEFPRQEWQELLKGDVTIPESFLIILEQSPGVFEGKYFITFSTTDKQTGIAHYEVQEGEREWKRADSPYLLEDQGLNDTIRVKAIDKAGNEYIAEHIPVIKKNKALFYWIITFSILIGAGLIWLKKKRQHKDSALFHDESASRNHYEEGE
ncbi:MAG: hypothetical protein KJI70_00595 [Patescibacteria group bacterium]|nr:hypothetical protein [Patescibacteria group bacterium]